MEIEMLHQFSRNELVIGTEGLEILKSIENEVGDTALWNWRIGYSYFFLEDYTRQKSIFLKVCEQEPDNEKSL